MKFRLLLLTLFVALVSHAQKGTVNGTLSDKDMNNSPLPFANVQLKGTTIGTTTDENGKYRIEAEPGNYILVLSFLGYESVEVPVSIKANQTVTINRSLSAGSGVQLQDVVVATSRRKNTEAALMTEMKEAKQVVSAISAEQMSKGTDGNAAEAVQRVPGVTIVDGKFVMIRGLSERYNNVLINNSIAPSTEVDKRTFSFDLIPTDAIDKIVIYKTASADKPGDFSGGVIAITTSESGAEFTRANIGIGYRANTSFNDYFQSEGSNTDFLGFDLNYRALPYGFPSRSQINDLPGVNAAASQRLKNNFNPIQSTAFFDNSVGFSLGRNINFANGMKLSTINALDYSEGFQSYKRQFTRYTSLNEGDTRPPVWFDYQDDTYKKENRITVLSNWILKLNDNNTIKFKNLFNQIGENETVLRSGRNILQRGDDQFRNYLLGYKARSIYIGQFEGNHNIGTKGKLDWTIGGNYIYESEPDLRRFRTIQPFDNPDAPFEMIDPPSANLFDTGRYFGFLSEYSLNNSVNYTHTIEQVKNDEEVGSIVLKTGYLTDYRSRNFDARYFSYLLPGSVVDNRNEIKQLPLTEIFNSINVNPNNGWVFNEGTRAIDSYDASNFLLAGYAFAEIPFYKFNFAGGIRVEHNVLKLNTNDETKAIIVDNPVTSILPSLNIAYTLSERSILRLAYGRTVNRPEFREIAPFVFYDFENEAGRRGTENLKPAQIDNIDLRYEFYPNKGETMSLGAFYKNFKDPIENVTEITTEQPQFKFQNAENAFSYGVEVEIRKSFKDISSVPFFSRLSTNLNASYIISEVDLGADVTSQDQKRVLQGQSPYIINAALGYADEKGFSANVIYNRFGNRIFSVGDNIFPTIYELSRDNIDLTLSKRIKNVTYKIGIQDLLNAKYQFFEDSNRDEKIEDAKDNPTSVFRRGTLFTFNVTYNF